MHEIQVEFKDGLVDPSVFLEFMDGCRCSKSTSWHAPDGHILEFHHAYFPKASFKGDAQPFVVRRLRSSKYNLIEMLSCQEDTYHQAVAMKVPQEKVDHDAAQTFLEESEWLTEYASSSLLVAEVQAKQERSGLTRVGKAYLAAQLVLTNEMMKADEGRVGRISVIDEKIVGGALTRYFEQQREQSLQGLLDSHLIKSPEIISTKIYNRRALRNKAEHRLRAKIESGNRITRNLLLRPIAVEVA